MATFAGAQAGAASADGMASIAMVRLPKPESPWLQGRVARGLHSQAPMAGTNEAAVAKEGANNDGATATKSIECVIRIGGVDFVLMPAALRASDVECSGAGSRGVNVTKRRLWEARRQAGLTQAQLAKRLGRSQAMVSQAESGHSHVSERYVNRVLEACELQPGWGLPEASSEAPSGWDIDPKDRAGLDPETLVPVRRGSERDLELRRTLVWWEGYQDET
jgi:transcriptional regulator with XRE-family HTH domain